MKPVKSELSPEVKMTKLGLSYFGHHIMRRQRHAEKKTLNSTGKCRRQEERKQEQDWFSKELTVLILQDGSRAVNNRTFWRT